MVQRHPVVNTRSLAPFFAWGVSYLTSCHLSCEMWAQGEGICPRVPPLPCVAQVLLVACSYVPVLGWQQGHCIASKQPRSWFSDQSPGLGSQSLANMNRIKILIPLVEVSGKTSSLSVMGVSPGLRTADSPERLSGAYPSRSLQGLNFCALTKSNWKPSIFVGKAKYFLIVIWTPFEDFPLNAKWQGIRIKNCNSEGCQIMGEKNPINNLQMLKSFILTLRSKMVWVFWAEMEVFYCEILII